MCRLLGWVARPGLTLRGVLGEDSFAAFANLSRIHEDGWGLAYEAHGNVASQRSTACAYTDPVFHAVASEVVSEAAVAHLRWASPGLPVEERNTHPFRYGQSAFAHNGGIYPLDRISGLLRPEWQARMTGTTDSEYYFLAVMTEVEDGKLDLPAAIAKVVGRIAAEYQPSSLNAMLLTPSSLYIVNCHDPSIRPALPPPEAQTVEDLVAVVEAEAPYYDLRFRRSDHGVVVASSGFAQPEGGGWQRMANNSVLVVDRPTLGVAQVPLDVQLGGSPSVEGLPSGLR